MRRTALRRRILSKYDTLGDFAEDMGVTRATITIWVNDGKIPAKRIKEMSEKLGIGKDEIWEVFFQKEGEV